jgi:hypothetical protein
VKCPKIVDSQPEEGNPGHRNSIVHVHVDTSPTEVDQHCNVEASPPDNVDEMLKEDTVTIVYCPVD